MMGKLSDAAFDHLGLRKARTEHKIDLKLLRKPAKLLGWYRQNNIIFELFLK